ncbi:MAG TPA: (d)CMP kinase [Gemmataceae bacterium]|nr:(d)CMP kinase [Gemmataceae bacterium]
MIVTIDGPAASGKGTAAKALARSLGFDYLDTGAMYRAVALALVRARIDFADLRAVEAALPGMRIGWAAGAVSLNGQDVTDAIREGEAAQNASKVAAIDAVRLFLVEQQHRIADGRDIICDGRDQGSFVFPTAPCKFYIDAAFETRVERRFQEHVKKGKAVTREWVSADIAERDTRDSTRHLGPLVRTPDMHHIDTTHMTPEEVLAKLEEVARRCLART